MMNFWNFFVEIMTYLMKYIVSKQLEHVTVTILGPPKVSIQLGSVDHGAKLGQKSEEAGRFDFLGQFSLDHV